MGESILGEVVETGSGRFDLAGKKYMVIDLCVSP